MDIGRNISTNIIIQYIKSIRLHVTEKNVFGSLMENVRKQL